MGRLRYMYLRKYLQTLLCSLPAIFRSFPISLLARCFARPHEREPGTGTQHLGTGSQNHTLFGRTYPLSPNKGASPTVRKRIVLLAVSVSAL